jgi:hypothetical protein
MSVNKAEIEKRPYGLSLAELDFELDSNEVEADYHELKRGDEYVPGIFDRVLNGPAHSVLFEEVVEQRGWGAHELTPHWLRWHAHGLELRHFEAISTSELAAVIYCLSFSGSLYDEYKSTPIGIYLWKLRNSAWRWHWNGFSWQKLVAFHNIIRSFDFGVNGFTVTLNHTDGSNERGYGVYYKDTSPTTWENTWLDAPFAFYVHYQGKHVLTIGFSTNGNGLAIHQIQLKEKKGNRWLYKLPCGPDGLVEHVVSQVHQVAAKYRMPVHLIDGVGAANYCAAQHTKYDRASGTRIPDLPDGWDETATRIISTYNQPLKKFERTKQYGTSWHSVAMTFHRVVRKRPKKTLSI